MPHAQCTSAWKKFLLPLFVLYCIWLVKQHQFNKKNQHKKHMGTYEQCLVYFIDWKDCHFDAYLHARSQTE